MKKQSAERISPNELLALIGKTPADNVEGYQYVVPWKSKLAGGQVRALFRYQELLKTMAGEPFFSDPGPRWRDGCWRRLRATGRGENTLILFLAANTSFNAFPRLAAILARDWGEAERLANLAAAQKAWPRTIAFLRQHLYGLYRLTGLWERSQYLDPMGLATWPPRLVNVTWPAGKEAITSMRDWAAEHGGFCDCEVLANVGSDYDDILNKP